MRTKLGLFHVPQRFRIEAVVEHYFALQGDKPFYPALVDVFLQAVTMRAVLLVTLESLIASAMSSSGRFRVMRTVWNLRSTSKEPSLTPQHHGHKLDLMIVTSIAHLKAHLSESLKKVREGETYEITDRNRAIARLVPLEAETLVERQPLETFRAVKPEFSRKIDAQALLNEERGSR
ncbi:MAG: type II toxin-antitoxin system prevent-host-death family antitoxin [Spirochaetota bacterium]